NMTTVLYLCHASLRRRSFSQATCPTAPARRIVRGAERHVSACGRRARARFTGSSGPAKARPRVKPLVMRGSPRQWLAAQAIDEHHREGWLPGAPWGGDPAAPWGREEDLGLDHGSV